MAIVPIEDGYTDKAPVGVNALVHTPVCVGNSRVVMVLDKGAGSGGGSMSGFTAMLDTSTGVSARVYTTSATGWTRGNVLTPTQTFSCQDSRASAATLDGNALLQVQLDTLVPRVVPSSDVVAFTYGVSWNVLQIDTTFTTWTQAQNFRLSHNVTVSGVRIFVVGIDSVGFGQVTANVYTTSNGTGVPVATGSMTITARDHSYVLVPLVGDLLAHTDYYLAFESSGSFNTGCIAGVYNPAVGGAYPEPPATITRYENWVAQSGLTMIWFELVGHTGTTTVQDVVTKTGYLVLGVNGTTLTEGPGVAIAGTDAHSYGPSRTAPEAMARIPLTNRFWAWRNYSNVSQLYIDLLQVTGTNVKVLGSVRVGGGGGYMTASTPRAIIPISGSEAISLLSLPDKLSLIHLAVDAAGVITVTPQDIIGYPPADGASLVAGLKYQAELLVKAGDDPLKLIRVGISWSGTAFNITALPITQLSAGLTPPDYTARTKAATVSVITGASQAALDGSHVTARRYDTDGTDDNWILLTEYDQDGGTIVCNTWVKGDVNGGKSDQLTLDALALRIDASSDRLILGSVERYLAAGADPDDVATSPRLGVYRRSYILDASKRSQREEFER